MSFFRKNCTVADEDVTGLDHGVLAETTSRQTARRTLEGRWPFVVDRQRPHAQVVPTNIRDTHHNSAIDCRRCPKEMATIRQGNTKQAMSLGGGLYQFNRVILTVRNAVFLVRNPSYLSIWFPLLHACNGCLLLCYHGKSIRANTQFY